jgi:hypothetical protein
MVRGYHPGGTLVRVLVAAEDYEHVIREDADMNRVCASIEENPRTSGSTVRSNKRLFNYLRAL